MKPLFIAFEGIDGSGKSSQVKLLAEKLSSDGHKVYTTFEPTDNPIGKMIRSVFSHKMVADEKTIAGLFLADRFEHLLNQTDGIIKKLAEGYTVITDRYYLSSYAYHGVHMPVEWVIEANRLCAELKRPDVNIFIDITPEISMERIAQNRANVELYETLENQKKVYSKYKEAIELVKNQEIIKQFDGTKSIEDLASDIYQYVKQLNSISY